MTHTEQKPWLALSIFLCFFLIISLACSFSIGTPSETPTPASPPTQAATATSAQKSSACLLPNVVGMDQQSAESALTVLGLTVEKQAAKSGTGPADTVLQQDPAAGTRMDPCQGKITLSISAAAASPTAPAKTTVAPAPTAGATATAGPKLTNPAAFEALYYYFFPAESSGFDASVWDVSEGANTDSTSKNGKLSLLGKIEALASDAAAYQPDQPVRIYLGGGTYGIGLKDFSLLFNYSTADDTYLALACSGRNYGSAGSMLACDLVKGKNGDEKVLPNTHADLCAEQCDLEIELKSGSVAVFAAGAQKILYKNPDPNEGTIGLRIDNPSSNPFQLDNIAIYEIPQSGAAYGTTIFREEFGGEWPVGEQNDAYSVTKRTIGSSGHGYTWEISAKQGVVTRSTLSTVVLPTNFRLYVDALRESGPNDAAYGVIFRMQENNSYYYFAVRDEGTIAVFLNQNGSWTELVKKTKVSVIKPGDENQLRVEGSGSQYTFYVNDTKVAQMNDTRLKDGGIGMAAELSQGNQAAQITFTGIGVERVK